MANAIVTYDSYKLTEKLFTYYSTDFLHNLNFEIGAYLASISMGLFLYL